MFEVYKDKQPLFYEEIIKSIRNNKINHAYMIETNNYKEKDDLIMSFIKMLFCDSHKTDLTNCNECNLCKLIDNNTLSDFMVVEPDGSWIKKDQVLEIKEKFKTTSFQNRPRIYLIKQADKLNKQAANSLLKFLEEPDGNVIAVLETDNRYKVLETIRSRCQIHTLINKEKKKEFSDFELLVKIIKVLEEKKKHAISYLPITLENDYRNKEFWLNIFSEMIDIYENAIRKVTNLNYNDYEEVLDFIIKNNDVSSIIHKVDVLFTTINRLDYNLNITMMLDQFIIEFAGGERNV